jgi:hypothetical protein
MRQSDEIRIENLITEFFRQINSDLDADPAVADLPESIQYGRWQLGSARNARERERERERIRAEDSSLVAIKNRVFRHHIQTLLDANFRGASPSERAYLEHYIEKQLWARMDYEDGEHSLSTFLTLGLEGIRKQKHREKRLERGMITRHLAMNAFWQLLAIALALYAFSRLRGKETVILLSATILIYSELASFIRGSTYSREYADVANSARFIELKREIGGVVRFAETDAWEKRTRNLMLDQWSLVLCYVGNAALAIIAIVHIVTAVIS